MGKTPLELAAAEGLVSTARLLLSAGRADPNAAETALGFTPLHTAAGKGFADVAEALLDAGADAARQNDQVRGKCGSFKVTVLYFVCAS